MLTAASLTPGQAIPWDRAFAMAQGDAPFDPAAPTFLPKSNFMCLLRNGRIALLRTGFTDSPPWLTITAPDGTHVAADPVNPHGRTKLGAFLTAYMGAEARGTPVFHFAPGHSFGDQRSPVISLLNRPPCARTRPTRVQCARTNASAPTSSLTASPGRNSAGSAIKCAWAGLCWR